MTRHTLVATLSETFWLGFGGGVEVEFSDFSLFMENLRPQNTPVLRFRKDGVLLRDHLETQSWDASFWYHTVKLMPFQHMCVLVHVCTKVKYLQREPRPNWSISFLTDTGLYWSQTVLSQSYFAYSPLQVVFRNILQPNILPCDAHVAPQSTADRCKSEKVDKIYSLERDISAPWRRS